jgi:hypothetical protein
VGLKVGLSTETKRIISAQLIMVNEKINVGFIQKLSDHSQAYSTICTLYLTSQLLGFLGSVIDNVHLARNFFV